MKRGRKKKITRKTRNEYRYLTAQIKKKLQHLSPSILWLFCEFIRLEPPCDKVEHRDALGHADSWRMVTCRQDRPRKVNNEQTSSSFSILILGGQECHSGPLHDLQQLLYFNPGGDGSHFQPLHDSGHLYCVPVDLCSPVNIPANLSSFDSN